MPLPQHYLLIYTVCIATGLRRDVFAGADGECYVFMHLVVEEVKALRLCATRKLLRLSCLSGMKAGVLTNPSLLLSEQFNVGAACSRRQSAMSEEQTDTTVQDFIGLFYCLATCVG